MIVKFTKAHWHTYKGSNITKSIHACSESETAKGGTEKGATRGNKQKTFDSPACTTHHWSMLKVSDMCLPFSFFPWYSNCSMGENRRGSPKHRGWICAFLFPITIPPDRQEHTYFQDFFGDVFYTLIGRVRSCRPCCIWWVKCKCKIQNSYTEKRKLSW